MAGLAQSKEGGQAMARASESLSLFNDPQKKGKDAPPTADHLIAEEQQKGQPPVPQTSGPEVKSGSFEKLSAMFGTPGPMFQLPAGK